jgi:hypothetical protein
MTQKNSIKYNSNEELIINGIPEKKKQAKLAPNVRNFESLNKRFDLFSN